MIRQSGFCHLDAGAKVGFWSPVEAGLDMLQKWRAYKQGGKATMAQLPDTLVIPRVIDSWRIAGVTLNPGASAHELSDLAQFLTIPLPQDVQAFYSLANGMTNDTHDVHEVSFWSIHRILECRQTRTDRDTLGQYRDCAIASFLIDSWYFWIRIREEQLSVFVEGTRKELPSFSHLLDTYLHHPDSLAIL